MTDWNQTVSLQQVVGTAFLSVVLLLVLLLASFVYFWLRLKYLSSRVANLEFEMKLVAQKAGLIPKGEGTK